MWKSHIAGVSRPAVWYWYDGSQMTGEQALFSCGGEQVQVLLSGALQDQISSQWHARELVVLETWQPLELWRATTSVPTMQQTRLRLWPRGLPDFKLVERGGVVDWLNRFFFFTCRR